MLTARPGMCSVSLNLDFFENGPAVTDAAPGGGAVAAYPGGSVAQPRSSVLARLISMWVKPPVRTS